MKDDDILIQKYEMLLYNKESMYFDSDEFEIIINYYMVKEKYADALEAMIHAELCHPDDIELALQKIRIMMQLDNSDRAFDLLLMLENKAPDLFEINLYKGHIYVLNDDIEAALREFEFAFEKCPEFDNEELRCIPSILIEHDYFEEALIFLHKFIDSDNATAKLFLKAGYCYEQTSNDVEAEFYYEKSLDEDPFDEKAWMVLGAFHLKLFDVDKALEAFEFALSINKDSRIASMCKVTALIKSNEYDKALKYFLEIMMKFSEESDYDDDEQYYEEFEDADDEENNDEKEFTVNLEMPYWKLSKILYIQGDIETAIQSIDKALETDPDNEDYIYFRGQCFTCISHDKDRMKKVLQNLKTVKESNYKESVDSEFVNKHKKAAFFYELENMEVCCKYLLESVLINSEGLELFFTLFPEAKDSAYIIKYIGKHLK
ncbi:MAG: hypothetical protein LBH60_06560 [Prevotellaceae bacterium]|jgi:tetratricopeptide (TPR) repeat protein|nr:hypothetical protein [Prevotellaceae bacterium]